MPVCEFCGKSGGAMKSDESIGWHYHKACLDREWGAEYGGMSNAEVMVAEGFEDLMDPAVVERIKADNRELLKF